MARGRGRPSKHRISWPHPWPGYAKSIRLNYGIHEGSRVVYVDLLDDDGSRLTKHAISLGITLRPGPEGEQDKALAEQQAIKKLAEVKAAKGIVSSPVETEILTRAPEWRDWPESRIVKQFQAEIDRLREVIAGMTPHELGNVLGAYYNVQTWNGYRLWEAKAIESIIEFAYPHRIIETPSYDLSYRHGDPSRVYCPLCHQGTTANWGKDSVGWAFPDGLQMHLEGRGVTNQCEVTKAAFGRALDYLRPRFQKAEAAERRIALARQKVERDAKRAERQAKRRDDGGEFIGYWPR